jgi:hypothetical protein
MNEHCNFGVINLINDDPFDYLLNRTSNQVEQEMISLVKMVNGF